MRVRVTEHVTGLSILGHFFSCVERLRSIESSFLQDTVRRPLDYERTRQRETRTSLCSQPVHYRVQTSSEYPLPTK